MTSDQREKKPLSCGTAQNISHLRLLYPLGTWNTRVSRRFGRIRELPLLLASRLQLGVQGQDPPSLGWTYYDSLGPASDGPANSTIVVKPELFDFVIFVGHLHWICPTAKKYKFNKFTNKELSFDAAQVHLEHGQRNDWGHISQVVI